MNVPGDARIPPSPHFVGDGPSLQFNDHFDFASLVTRWILRTNPPGWQIKRDSAGG